MSGRGWPISRISNEVMNFHKRANRFVSLASREMIGS